MRNLLLVLIFERILRSSSHSKYGYTEDGSSLRNYGDTYISPGYIQQRDTHPAPGLGSASDDFGISTKSDGEDFPKLILHGKQRLKYSHDNNKFKTQNYDDYIDNQMHEKENEGRDGKKLARKLNDANYEQELDDEGNEDDNQKHAEENNDYGDNEEHDKRLNDGDKQEFADEEHDGGLNDANDEQEFTDQGNDYDNYQTRTEENNDYGGNEEHDERLNDGDKQEFDYEEHDGGLNDANDEQEFTKQQNDHDNYQTRTEENNDYGGNEEHDERLNDGDKQELDYEEHDGGLNDANDEQEFTKQQNDHDNYQTRTEENNDHGGNEEHDDQLNDGNKQEFDDEEHDEGLDDEEHDEGLDDANDEQEFSEQGNEDDNYQTRIEENNDYGSNETRDNGDKKENNDEEIKALGNINDGSRENFNNKDSKIYKKHQETEEKLKDSMIFDPDYDETEENEVNSAEYKDNCPKECSARQVMVCARCMHNIHRTFLSLCHLRMFNCKHPNEKLELVSRRPCIQSAPFLTDFPPAKAKLSAPGDQDTVLKFIRCRERGRLERDPSCEFRQK